MSDLFSELRHLRTKRAESHRSISTEVRDKTTDLFSELQHLRTKRAEPHRRMSTEVKEPFGIASGVNLRLTKSYELLNKRIAEFKNDIYARLDKKPRKER